MKRLEAKTSDLSADSYSRLFPVQIRRLQHRFIAVNPRPNPEESAPGTARSYSCRSPDRTCTRWKPQRRPGSKTARKRWKMLKEIRDINGDSTSH